MANKQSTAALAKEAGIPVNTVYARLRAGWSMKDALNTPVGERLGRPVKKKAAAKKKRAAAKRRASVTHTTTKTTKVEYSSEPDKKKLPKVTNPLASDSAVPGFIDPLDEHLTLASTSQRKLEGDGPIVDPEKDTGWIWLVLIIGALALGSYGLLKGIAGV
jgi:hypothetical protein